MLLSFLLYDAFEASEAFEAFETLEIFMTHSSTIETITVQ